ncbi:hypothetical protein HQ865_00350 [Mucilaginibacter mali]|uniref:Uncharacterized protein n=1 Tax=Mucilaginibacter mali TaxID=2740462 RepID=A0A7D4Q558_9SPHI|nr:hypothetical protein [Mucilaginibacter mali]QKJ28271.1 hypothetical protein HQ865_00350 [Mucilaginibacter mali]
MGKADIKTGGETQSPFNIKTYSVSEILAAGGTTAFANQLGKNTQHTIARLKALPKEDFLTDEEAKAALEYLKNNK